MVSVSLTYELFGLAILKFTRQSNERKDLCVDDSAPSQLNSGINKVPEVTGSQKSFLEEALGTLSSKSRKNLKNGIPEKCGLAIGLRKQS